MGFEYKYDEDLSTFPFFLFTVGLVVAIPTTYFALKPSANAIDKAPIVNSNYRIKDYKTIVALRNVEKAKQRRFWTGLVAIISWIIVFGALYLCVVRPEPETIAAYNPYDILGIPDSATEREIKSKYRKLSIKLHPDKVRPDPAKNETKETVEVAYINLKKAYEALTNEDIRRNWLEYGHPDGRPDDLSFGIALPKWMVTEGNGKWVLGAYALLFGVILPWTVSSWWYGTQKMSKEGILMESANNMFLEYTDDMDEGAVIGVLSCGVEFKDIISKKKANVGLTEIEAKISGLLTSKNREKLEAMDDAVRRKTLTLLWAYLNRINLEDHTLEKAKYQVAPIARHLAKALTSISLAYGFTDPILASFHVGQRLVQAIPPKASELLQLPFYNSKVIEAVDGDSRGHVSFEQYMSLPDAIRKHLAVTKGGLSASEYESAMGVAKQLPKLQVERAFFKVTGEKFITPSALVNLVVKSRVIPYGIENIPKPEEYQLEDPDPAEDDLDAINGKKKKTIKTADGKVVTMAEENILPTRTFAPYFARDFTPSWYIFLTDSKNGKMAVPPFKFPVLDEPIFDKDGRPTFNIQTMKAVFAAPPSAGDYTFVMHVICDSYLGLDTKTEVTLHVEDASRAIEIESEGEISEPEEDTIAGAMYMLKEGKMPKPREVDSDESGTDDDEDDDTSDTNTDTEDEGDS